MEGNAPSSFCERCGFPASIQAGSVHSCLLCDRYVGTECWDARRRRCGDCAPLTARASKARDMMLLRRVDRRLREVARDAIALSMQSAEADGSTIDAELVCLRLKTSNALENGEDALARRLRGARAGDVEALASRIGVHALLADSAVARAESAAVAASARDAASGPPVLVRQLVLGGLAGVAAAVVAVVVLTGILDPDPFEREGVLGGAPGDGSSSPTGPIGGTQTARPNAQEHPVLLAFDFNDVRMGEGIGEEWGGQPTTAAGDSIQVAAFPTSFDRSARLTSSGRPDVAACASVVPQDVERVGFDVYIDPARPAVGTLSLYAANGEPALQIVIDPEGQLSARVPTGELPLGPRIAAGAWRRVELVAEAGDLRWRVRSFDETNHVVTDGSLGQVDLVPITRVCLAALGPAGRAVSYDNLEIHGINTGG